MNNAYLIKNWEFKKIKLKKSFNLPFQSIINVLSSDVIIFGCFFLKSCLIPEQHNSIYTSTYVIMNSYKILPHYSYQLEKWGD